MTAARAFAAAGRREKLRRAASEVFDLVVVGGGINGAGIAREAALRGLRTLLIEKGDFASGTSSRSSKLVHGGLRYLEHRQIGLVWAASRERERLRRLAPHLVRPQRFCFPVYRGDPIAPWKLRAGLSFYDLLAAFRNVGRHRFVGLEGARDVEPELREEGLQVAALYYDCVTDDARLVLETVLAAEQAGALCLNYVVLEGFGKSAGRIDAVELFDLDGSLRFRAATRTAVNAAGPWLDRIRALDDPTAEPVLRPTKGVHLVLPRERIGNRNAVVLRSRRDRRLLFAIPWEDLTLLGTTDTDFAGDPDRVEVEAEDVADLLEAANFYFPRARLSPRDVVSAFAGLRPLVAEAGAERPTEVSREERIFESASGLLSLGGGKLTTYRRIAVKVVDRVARRLAAEHGILARPRSGTEREPLPGAAGDVPDAGRARGELEDFLRSRYGTQADRLLEVLLQRPDLAERIVPETPHVRAEAWFSAAEEMALRVEDVLRRRTQVALRTRDGGLRAAADVAALMAGPLGWDGPTVEARAAELHSEPRTGRCLREA
jgi:glycerol-3-phosphate dehydrogenase